jgi:hypothetical protein
MRFSKRIATPGKVSPNFGSPGASLSAMTTDKPEIANCRAAIAPAGPAPAMSAWRW